MGLGCGSQSGPATRRDRDGSGDWRVHGVPARSRFALVRGPEHGRVGAWINDSPHQDTKQALGWVTRNLQPAGAHSLRLDSHPSAPGLFTPRRERGGLAGLNGFNE